jgi:hypothetical protein
MDRRALLDGLIQDAENAIKARTAVAKPRKRKKVKIGAVAKPDFEASKWINDTEVERATKEWEKKFGAKWVKEFEERAERELADPDVRLVRNEKFDTLMKHFSGLEADGTAPRFKSQHETGTSQGCNNPAYRKKVEEWLFSLVRFGKNPKDKADSAVYGWISRYSTLIKGSVYQSANQYGDVSCVIRNSERYRTTLTLCDSLAQSATPVPINAPQVGMLRQTAETYSKDRWESTGKNSGIFCGSPYSEIQVHGRLSLEDIEEFIVDNQTKADKLQPIADRWGIKITVRI